MVGSLSLNLDFAKNECLEALNNQMIYSIVIYVYKTTTVQNIQHLQVGVDMTVVSASRVFNFQIEIVLFQVYYQNQNKMREYQF